MEMHTDAEANQTPRKHPESIQNEHQNIRSASRISISHLTDASLKLVLWASPVMAEKFSTAELRAADGQTGDG